jgi:hypothetical protein
MAGKSCSSDKLNSLWKDKGSVIYVILEIISYGNRFHWHKDYAFKKSLRKGGCEMKKLFGIGIGVILFVSCFSVPIAKADYTSGFESLNASAGGTLLTGQDAFYKPDTSANDYYVYTYSGNALGLPQNPVGGSQFVAGTSLGDVAYGRAQRDVDFSTARVWTIGYDFAGNYMGTAGTTSQALGSFSTQPSSGSAAFIQLMWWVDLGNPGNGFNAFYLAYDSSGFQFSQPGASPGAAWENLAVNHWYHAFTTFDMTSNLIIEVGIKDLTTNVETIFNPTDWYLGGGQYGSVDPTAFRFFAGGVNGGNMMAFDNISSSSQPVPEPTTMLLVGSGLIGLAGYGKKKFFKK